MITGVLSNAQHTYKFIGFSEFSEVSIIFSNL